MNNCVDLLFNQINYFCNMNLISNNNNNSNYNTNNYNTNNTNTNNYNTNNTNNYNTNNTNNHNYNTNYNTNNIIYTNNHNTNVNIEYESNNIKQIEENNRNIPNNTKETFHEPIICCLPICYNDNLLDIPISYCCLLSNSDCGSCDCGSCDCDCRGCDCRGCDCGGCDCRDCDITGIGILLAILIIVISFILIFSNIIISIIGIILVYYIPNKYSRIKSINPNKYSLYLSLKSCLISIIVCFLLLSSTIIISINLYYFNNINVKYLFTCWVKNFSFMNNISHEFAFYLGLFLLFLFSCIILCIICFLLTFSLTRIILYYHGNSPYQADFSSSNHFHISSQPIRINYSQLI